MELVGSNHSPFVPYAKFGMGYGRASGSVLGFGASMGAPAIAAGAGLRAYLNHHVGIEAQVLERRRMGPLAAKGVEAVLDEFRG